MNGPNTVRVVLGVRSSAHYPVPAEAPGAAFLTTVQGLLARASHGMMNFN